MKEPGAESAIVVEFPSLDEHVDSYRNQLDPSRAWGMPAHVTLLYPFVAPSDLNEEFLGRVESSLAGVTPFDVSFFEVKWFGDQVVWLHPSPSLPLKVMTDRLMAEFPTLKPYGGAITVPIPHLTVGDGADLDKLKSVASRLEAVLPLSAHVTTVSIMSGSNLPNSWSVIKRIELLPNQLIP
ncbi:2'-5' RNA ligase family protein [Glaciibacter superstes]|uniref:2'-5' RNA ligase family protein n=1 Tax=Glaciibacter superstes TaxID=501023 RepID=UPI0003B70548|nr:2'-5' RNA ligase family protein [Glaciibacter superstes]